MLCNLWKLLLWVSHEKDWLKLKTSQNGGALTVSSWHYHSQSISINTLDTPAACISICKALWDVSLSVLRVHFYHLTLGRKQVRDTNTWTLDMWFSCVSCPQVVSPLRLDANRIQQSRAVNLNAERVICLYVSEFGVSSYFT